MLIRKGGEKALKYQGKNVKAKIRKQHTKCQTKKLSKGNIRDVIAILRLSVVFEGLEVGNEVTFIELVEDELGETDFVVTAVNEVSFTELVEDELGETVVVIGVEDAMLVFEFVASDNDDVDNFPDELDVEAILVVAIADEVSTGEGVIVHIGSFVSLAGSPYNSSWCTTHRVPLNDSYTIKRNISCAREGKSKSIPASNRTMRVFMRPSTVTFSPVGKTSLFVA